MLDSEPLVSSHSTSVPLACLNQQAAAKRLGITTRTLRSHTEKGLLEGRERRFKGRRQVMYSVAELDAFVARQKTERARKSQAPPKELVVSDAPEGALEGQDEAKLPSVIALRLPRHYSQRLHEQAEQRGLSDSEYARQVVIAGLEAQGNIAVAGALEEVSKRLSDQFQTASERQQQQAEARWQTQREDMEKIAATLRSLDQGQASGALALGREIGAWVQGTLRQSVAPLRDDLAAATFVLLIEAGGVTPEKAEAWVRANLYRDASGPQSSGAT